MVTKSKSTTSRTAAQRKPLPAVHGTTRLVQAIGTIGPEHLRRGKIEINRKWYFVRVLDAGYELIGWDERREESTNYQLPGDLSQCECLDWLSRSQRRADNRCKHQKALGALVASGKLPRIVCQPVPHVDLEEVLDAA